MLVECLDDAGKGKADVRAKAGIIDLVSSKSGGGKKMTGRSATTAGGYRRQGQDILMGFADHMTKTPVSSTIDCSSAESFCVFVIPDSWTRRRNAGRHQDRKG